MQERNCQNEKCGKPLIKKQQKYCSRACQFLGRRSHKAEKIWELRLTRPELTVMEIAQLAGVAYKYADGVLYSYVSRPEGLLKRKYKPRKPKAKAEIPIVEGPPPVKEPEPLPEGKYGKHVAPGWLWNAGEELEEKYGHLGKRKK
jgi:hypothetical protein